ncbi:MAG: PqqD family protein [Candidatus Hydrogenedentota bacterium]
MKKFNKKRFKINSDKVIWKNFGDEIVFLNFKTQHYYSLNSTGMRIWELLFENKIYEEIIDICCDEYDADIDLVTASIDDLLNDLVKEGFIQVI